MEKGKQNAAVLGIGTSVPEYCLDQDAISQQLAEALSNDPHSARWAKKIFKQCGVKNRYTCEPDLLKSARDCRYVSPEFRRIPSTGERMETYKRHSVPLSLQAAERSLRESGLRPSDITHLITVSCTGLYLPGLDIVLIRELGLPPNVRRIPLNFLGCAAGLTAVRMAGEIADHDPSAKVLIVSVELCTLHIQPSTDRDTLFAAAFFGDGAASCVVGVPSSGYRGAFVLGLRRSAVFPGCEEEMVWDVGNFGFHLYLSPNIPKLLRAFLPAEMEKLTDGGPLPELWAIHPGGRGIVDALQNAYGLTDEQTRASRSVLWRFGNMSSATIFFVLQEMRNELLGATGKPKEGIALAFGPGLHAEMIRFTYFPSWIADQASAQSQYPEVARTF